MTGHMENGRWGDFRAGYLLCLPIAVSVALFGLIYGLLAAQKGLSMVETVGMSLIVFAGSSQLLALELWSSPINIIGLGLAVLIINLRYLMQTATLGDLLKPWGWRGFLAVLFNADENWAVSVAEMRKRAITPWFYMGAAMALYSFWVISSGFGWLAGGIAPDAEKYGLGFVGTAVFLFLLNAMVRQRSDLLPIATAAAAAVAVSLWLPGTWYILAGGLAGSFAGVLMDMRGTRHA